MGGRPVGEKVIVASRSVVVTLVICRRAEKRMELVPRGQKPSKIPLLPIANSVLPPTPPGHKRDLAQRGCPLQNTLLAPGMRGPKSWLQS